jgi:hypothetical protein
MAQLRGMEVYRWPVIKALAPVYVGTLLLNFVPRFLERPLQGWYGNFPWLHDIIVGLPFVGLGYFALVGFSLFFGWETALTRRTHKRVEKALRQGRDDSDP